MKGACYLANCSMLSHKCKYAIRAVIFLASRNKQMQKTGGTEIAEDLKIPVAFTVKILQELARKNLILSTKGPKGGFYIDDELKKLPMLAIVEAIDGIDFFNRCGVGLHQCKDSHPCPFHDTFKATRDTLFNAFSTRTIGDFCVDFLDDNYFLTEEDS